MLHDTLAVRVSNAALLQRSTAAWASNAASTTSAVLTACSLYCLHSHRCGAIALLKYAIYDAVIIVCNASAVLSFVCIANVTTAATADLSPAVAAVTQFGPTALITTGTSHSLSQLRLTTFGRLDVQQPGQQ